MSYKRTQVYLDPEDHRRLVETSKRRGVSLTSLVRDIVASYVRQGSAARVPKGFDAIVGLSDADPTDVAKDEQSVREAALEERLQRKLGAKTAPKGRRVRKSGRAR